MLEIKSFLISRLDKVMLVIERERKRSIVLVTRRSSSNLQRHLCRQGELL